MEHCILYKNIFLAVVVFLAIKRTRGKVRNCLASLCMEVLKACPSLVVSVSSMNTELVHADVFFSGRAITFKCLHCKMMSRYVRSNVSREHALLHRDLYPFLPGPVMRMLVS